MPKMVSIRFALCRSGSQIVRYRSALGARIVAPLGGKSRSNEIKKFSAKKLDIEIGNAISVSALLVPPPQAHACFVFAHGAGAGMTHPFMEAFAAGLCERGGANGILRDRRRVWPL